MSITINSIIDTKNDFWEVSLAGELDVSTADELKKSLHKLVDEKNIDMKLNLENLDYIDSTGLGVMIGILKRLKIENKEVYIRFLKWRDSFDLRNNKNGDFSKS